MAHFKIGDKIGPFEIIGKNEHNKTWIVKCFCGNIFEKYTDQLDFRQKTCGDRQKHDATFLEVKERIEKDIRDQKQYGNLTIVGYNGFYSRTNGPRKRHYVKCRCTCGNIVERHYHGLEIGEAYTCGPHHILPRKIEMNITPIVEEIYYLRWKSMHDRCYKSNRHNYDLYGGKGIYVCEEWRYYPGDKTKQELNRQNYKNYEKWLNDQLKKEDLSYEQFIKFNYSVDRIDGKGPYSPENCRIVSQIEQCNNKETNRYVYYKDKKISPMELSRTSDFHWKKVYGDLKSVEYDTKALILKRNQYLNWIEKFLNMVSTLSPYIRDNYNFLIDKTDHYNFNYLIHKKYKYIVKSSSENKTIKDSSGKEYYIPERIRYQ